jgi:hypothetical protein
MEKLTLSDDDDYKAVHAVNNTLQIRYSMACIPCNNLMLRMIPVVLYVDHEQLIYKSSNINWSAMNFTFAVIVASTRLTISQIDSKLALLQHSFWQAGMQIKAFSYQRLGLKIVFLQYYVD